MTTRSITRRRNHLVWLGVLVSLLGLITYFTVFVRCPALRDFPWLNLPAVLIGLGLSLWALTRRVSLWSVAGLAVSVACAGLLVAYVFFLSSQLPGPESVVAVGEPAPPLALQDQQGRLVELDDYRGSRLILVFYRGFW